MRFIKGLLLFFLLIPFMFSYCDGNYLSGNWVISNSTSCSDEVIYVTGNINIFSNGTPPSTDEYFNNNEFNLSKYSGYIETEQVPNGLGNNPAYSGDWENNASFVYKTFMNNSQHAIQIFHNQTQNIGVEEAVYAMNIDNNQSSGYYGLDLFFGNSTEYGLHGVFVYNSSYPGIFYPIPSGTVYTSGSEWGNTNLSNNCSIYYYSKDNLLEIAINCTGGFTSKTVTGLNDKYTIFTNGSTTFQQGNLTLDNVTLVFNQTYSGQHKFWFSSDYAIFHGENITITTNDTSYKYNISLESYDGTFMSNHNFYLNNSNIGYVNATGFLMNKINGSLNITNNVFHNFTNTFPVFSMSEINNSIISGNTIYYNDSGSATPFYMTDNNFYNRIENNYLVGQADVYRGFSFINSDNDYNNFTNNSGNISFQFTGEDQNNEGNILRNNQIYSMAFDNITALNTLIYNNSYGSINWTLGNLSSSIPISLDNFTFSTANITFDSTNYPNLNDSASLIFYGVISGDTPYLLKDGVRCDNTSDCNITYEGTTLYADVSGFSSYYAQSQGKRTIVVNGSFDASGNGTVYFDTILEAYNNATDGDTILIFENSSNPNGYEENLNISKELNITGYTHDVLVTAKDVSQEVFDITETCNISNLKVNGTTNLGLSAIRFNGNSNYSKAINMSVCDSINGIAILSYGVQVIDSIIEDNTNSGIAISSAWYTLVENSTFSGNGAYGISYDGGYYNNITNTGFRESITAISSSNNNYYGIFDNITIIDTYSGFAFEVGGGHNIINSNMENNAYYGIYANNSNSGIHAINNTIINSSLNGIKFSYSNDSEVINNTIINSSFDGIALYDSNNNLVQNNTVYGCSDAGIIIFLEGNQNITNITINKNIVYDAVVGGIAFVIDTSTWDIKNAEVTENIIYNTGYGIYSNTARTLEVTYNNISNTTNTSIYIYNPNGGDCLVSYNNINNCSNYGGEIGESAGAISLDSEESTNNTVSYNNISSAYKGLDLYSNDSNVHNNTFTDISEFGINLEYTSNSNISDNNFTNISYNAFILSENDNVIIQNNNIINVTESIIFIDEEGVFNVRGAFNLYLATNIQIINNTVNESLDGVYSEFSTITKFSGNSFNTTNYSIYLNQSSLVSTENNYLVKTVSNTNPAIKQIGSNISIRGGLLKLN